jgi:hypothetical protein
MRTLLISTAMLLVAATAAEAQHAGSFTGRRGNTTSWNSNVANGTATGSVTGPRGNTVSGTASEHYEGHGAYGVTGSVTGPRGVTRSGSATVYPR